MFQAQVTLVSYVCLMHFGKPLDHVLLSEEFHRKYLAQYYEVSLHDRIIGVAYNCKAYL
jgi:hypothetical protein